MYLLGINRPDPHDTDRERDDKVVCESLLGRALDLFQRRSGLTTLDVLPDGASKEHGFLPTNDKGRDWSMLTHECVPSKWDRYGPTTYDGGKISIHPTMLSTITLLFWSARRFREGCPKRIPDPRSPSENAAGVHNTAETRANRGEDESTRHGRAENKRGARRKRDQYRERNAAVCGWVSVICNTKGFQTWTVKLDGNAAPHQEQPKDKQRRGSYPSGTPNVDVPLDGRATL